MAALTAVVADLKPGSVNLSKAEQDLRKAETSWIAYRSSCPDTTSFPIFDDTVLGYIGVAANALLQQPAQTANASASANNGLTFLSQNTPPPYRSSPKIIAELIRLLQREEKRLPRHK